MDAFREVGPGGHFFGCEHTQANYKDAFWQSEVLDYRNFESWEDAGSPDTMKLAHERVKKMLASYQQPALDPAVSEALDAYLVEKKASMPDTFV